jgi:hypothetical protein
MQSDNMLCHELAYHDVLTVFVSERS